MAKLVTINLQAEPETGTWYFDDESVGLKKEPFIGEINSIILDLYLHKHGTDYGLDRCKVRVTDCRELIGVCDAHLVYIGKGKEIHPVDVFDPECEEETTSDGYIYRFLDEYDVWLCPTLLKYFQTPPANLYAEILPADEKAS